MKIQRLIKFSVMLATSATIVFTPIGSSFTIGTTQAYAKTIYTEDGKSFELQDWVLKYKDTGDEDIVFTDYWSKEAVLEAQKTCKVQNSYFLYDSGISEQVKPYDYNNKKWYKEGVSLYSNTEYNMIELMSYGFDDTNGRRLANGLYGTMIIDGKEYYNGSDITSKIVSATSTKNYHDNRKSYYYTTGLMDTYENATKMKSTVFYFTAPYTGQVKLRTIEPLFLRVAQTPLDGYLGGCETAFGIYDVETGKSISTKNATATNDISPTYKHYFGGDIVKGKKYAIVINSAGALNTSEIEMFFMKYYNVDEKYSKNTWYTRTIATNKTDVKSLRNICLKVKLDKKSKVTLYLKNLNHYEEDISSKIKRIDVYDGKSMERGTLKSVKYILNRDGVEVSKALGKFTFTLEKGTYYIPITVSSSMYDVTFKYTVTPVK